MYHKLSIKRVITGIVLSLLMAVFLPWAQLTARAEGDKLDGCAVGSILRTDEENAKFYFYVPKVELAEGQHVEIFYYVDAISDAPAARNIFASESHFTATVKKNNLITLGSADGMSKGPKVAYVAAAIVDSEGNVTENQSAVLEAKMPYDVYYTEDFETYGEYEYLVHSDSEPPTDYEGRPFLYLHAGGIGTGQKDQLVLGQISENKYLVAKGQDGAGVDACVSFGKELKDGFYIYKCSVNKRDDGNDHGFGRSAIYAGQYQRMNEFHLGTQGNGVAGIASGIHSKSNCLGAKELDKYIEIGEMPKYIDVDFKLVIDTYNNKYSVYVNDEKMDQNDYFEDDDLRYDFSQALRYIGIYEATGVTLYDNLCFYKMDGVPIPTAITGLKANSTEQTGVDFINSDSFYTYTGQVKATEAGRYSATFTLKDGYIWEDGTTEPKTVNWKIMGDTAILTIKSYDGSETLAEIPVPKADVDGGSKDFFETFLTGENEKFAAYMYSNEPEGEIINYVKNLYYVSIIVNHATDKDELYVKIYDDVTLYAKPPIIVNKALNYDLSNGKTVTIIGADLSEAGPTYYKGRYFADDSANDFLFYFYYSTMISEMWYEGEFDKVAGKTIFEDKDVIFDYDYYLAPIPYDSEKLAEGDVFLADEYFGQTSIYTHISIEPEEDSVMKIHMSKNDDGKTVMTLSGIECDTVKEATVLSLGRFPKDVGMYELVMSDEDMVYYIFDSCTLKVKFGNAPTPAPTATVEPTTEPIDIGEPTPSAVPSASPEVTPTADPASDLTKVFPEAENITVEEKQQAIENANTDKDDVKGSTQKFLKLKGVPKKKNAIKLTWKSIKQADGYIIYGSKCGSKMKYITTVKGSGKKTFTVKKLKKGTYYKYMVVAYKTTPSGDKVLTSSKSVHVATDGSKKGNPSKLIVKKSKLKVKKGKTVKIKAKVKNPKGKKVSTHIAKVRYESSDPSVATVNKKGKVKGLTKGKTATIYVYSQNGLCKTVKVTVK